MRPPSATPLALVSELLRIRPGQSQMLYWTAGTVVTPLRGAVWLSETPHWLGEHLLRPRYRVEAHATHVLAHTGWVVLRAEHDAVLRVRPAYPAQHAWPPVVKPVRAFAASAWRRLFGRPPARLA